MQIGQNDILSANPRITARLKQGWHFNQAYSAGRLAQ